MARKKTKTHHIYHSLGTMIDPLEMIWVITCNHCHFWLATCGNIPKCSARLGLTLYPSVSWNLRPNICFIKLKLSASTVAAVDPSVLHALINRFKHGHLLFHPCSRKSTALVPLKDDIPLVPIINFLVVDVAHAVTSWQIQQVCLRMAKATTS